VPSESASRSKLDGLCTYAGAILLAKGPRRDTLSAPQPLNVLAGLSALRCAEGDSRGSAAVTLMLAQARSMQSYLRIHAHSVHSDVVAGTICALTSVFHLSPRPRGRVRADMHQGLRPNQCSRLAYQRIRLAWAQASDAAANMVAALLAIWLRRLRLRHEGHALSSDHQVHDQPLCP
jgi:hypothetical protein